ncbi:hypothetical protein, partial [Pyramidobacter piscolens]|uniref:hypothetical protein n=1 Tax=Pyramidobacter piscolens TaxID=638849 RepID=UPI003AB1ED66
MTSSDASSAETSAVSAPMPRAIAYEKPLEEIANKLMRRRELQRRKVSSSQESLPAVEYKETPKTP